jgi:hypothetical protein
MRSRSLLVVLLVAASAALACSQGQQSQEVQQQATSNTSAAMSTASQTLMLHPMNESDITGSVALSSSTDTLTVKLDLDHLTPGDDYTAHIYHGTCEMQGPEAVALKSVLASEEGTGSSTTMVPLSAFRETATEDRHEGFFIQVLQPDAERAACVELPREGGDVM